MEPPRAQPRRYAKACDACHRKKIKCDWDGSSCTLCRKASQTCVFTRIERSDRKKARRGNDLSALEGRLKDMEALLQSQRKHGQDDARTLPSSEDSASCGRPSQSPLEASERQYAAEVPITPPDSEFPPRDRALHLAKGFLCSCNTLFPVFNAGHILQRMTQNWPPNKQVDLVWWTTAMVVLCYAHRLRAMSDPSGADADNDEAYRYLTKVLEVAPALPYSKPTLDTAQVLLAIASILRGTAMQGPARMLIGSAANILQDLDAHKEETPDSPYYTSRDDRARVFWVAYISDKSQALITGKPPVFYEPEISRLPPMASNVEGFTLVQSLDSLREVNFLVTAHRLAIIQGQLWSRLHSATSNPTPSALATTQNELNALLLAWRTALPFSFKPHELVGQWPKHSIIYIMLLHFQYFQTLVYVNREPLIGDLCTNPAYETCPTAMKLQSYAFSTAPFVVSAARHALELASLTPRGNFQHVWLFIDFSISVVLTLLMNAVVRPLDDSVCEDFRRVDEWLQIIEALASSSERPDLLEKKRLLIEVRTWSLSCVMDALNEKDANDAAAQARASFIALGLSDGQWYDSSLQGSVLHPDIFPLDQSDGASWDWMYNSSVIM